MFIMISVVCVLILPANFSTAGILFAVCVMLLFVGRASFKQLLGLCSITIVAAALLVASLYGLQKAGADTVVTRRAETWVNRVERYWSGEVKEDILGDHFQAHQAKIAVGTGGLFGNGLGKSVQRNYLPHSYSDFIFAIIIEEYGLVFGGLVIILLYLTLLYRTILIIRKCDKTFPAFLVFGLSLIIVFQAFINMAVAVGLLPVTGQPLPLISMGGTSIVFTGVSFGIILSVSREVRGNEEPIERKKTKNNTTEQEANNETEEEIIPQTA